MQSRIKIIVSHHNESEIISNDLIVPVQVGADINKVQLDMLRDNTGDNISSKNDIYCELTAQYWAWKNIDADYFGFMHYRRHFIFKDIEEEPDDAGMIPFKRITGTYLDYIGLNENVISGIVNNYDVLLPTPIDVTSFGAPNNEVQFCSLEWLYARDFDRVLDVVTQLYPDYKIDTDEFRHSSKAYWYNMFIFKSEIFHDYCKWLFTILFEAEKKTSFIYYTQAERRTLAFMAERLLSIYILHLQRVKPDLKVRHLKMSFIEKTKPMQRVLPAFKTHNVPITVSCNEYYMPYLGVMLYSMLKNASKERNYDILVLQRSNKFSDNEELLSHNRLLSNMVREYKNAHVRFLDVSELLGEIDFPLTAHFSVETYFRLFLPKLLPEYDKVIYLDADMVVCHDISELYDINLEGNILGAAHDPNISGSNKAPTFDRKDYISKLGIKNIYNYFQAGVLLIDIKKLGENGLCERMIEYAVTHKCEFVDQDVLNVFLQDKVKFIDLRWNIEITTNIMNVAKYLPADMWKEYQEGRKNAYIYHFAGTDKPWINPTIEYADIFWQEARETPWYEYILVKLIKSVALRVPTSELNIWNKGIEDNVLPLIKAHKELAELKKTDYLQAIAEEMSKNELLFSSLQKGKKLMFYGAGNKCRELLMYFVQLELDFPEVIWDQAAKQGQCMYNVPVVKPDFSALSGSDDILFVITIERKTISEQVASEFRNAGFFNIMTYREILKSLSFKLWNKLESERGGTEDI